MMVSGGPCLVIQRCGEDAVPFAGDPVSVACLSKHSSDQGLALPLQLGGERCQFGCEDLLLAGEVLQGSLGGRTIRLRVGRILYLEPPGANWAMVTWGAHSGCSSGQATMAPMKAKETTMRAVQP
ncbi:hypothetical protein [Microvirga lotononidis]|uniref:hypothetical protein n=1 Tax=Microvirga lotononidis TaxID=864069 RepID=UPI00058ACFC8|nr:hypothetical protein [Microvirga lotononidis]